jgi:hypothetical protein
MVNKPLILTIMPRYTADVSVVCLADGAAVVAGDLKYPHSPDNGAATLLPGRELRPTSGWRFGWPPNLRMRFRPLENRQIRYSQDVS